MEKENLNSWSLLLTVLLVRFFFPKENISKLDLYVYCVVFLDEESRQSEIEVRVRVLDQNDNNPRFYGYTRLQKLGNDRRVLDQMPGKERS